MSFLNPINEPVLRFKSTDAGAPQINYNARTAGDVKAVLKACLVDGYGTTASAGWSIINEVNHVAEFVSPSVAMSDYRLGVDDTSTSSTAWYYQYQNVKTTPSFNTAPKSFNYINRTSSNNGWELLVTNRGWYFIESLHHTQADVNVCRIMYMGAAKSALLPTSTQNISLLIVGYNSEAPNISSFFSPSNSSYRHYNINGYTSIVFSAANINAFAVEGQTYNQSSVDMIAPVYLFSGTVMVGQQPALMLQSLATDTDLHTTKTVDIENVTYARYFLSKSESTTLNLNRFGVFVLLRLQDWEY